MYNLDVSTSSRVLLANSNPCCMHLVVADHSVQCETKSHGVQATAVEKANAGTLEWCLGSSVFPLYIKQQAIFTLENLSLAGLPRHTKLRCDVTFTTFHCVLMKKSVMAHNFLSMYF